MIELNLIVSDYSTHKAITSNTASSALLLTSTTLSSVLLNVAASMSLTGNLDLMSASTPPSLANWDPYCPPPATRPSIVEAIELYPGLPMLTPDDV